MVTDDESPLECIGRPNVVHVRYHTTLGPVTLHTAGTRFARTAPEENPFGPRGSHDLAPGT